MCFRSTLCHLPVYFVCVCVCERYFFIIMKRFPMKNDFQMFHRSFVRSNESKAASDFSLLYSTQVQFVEIKSQEIYWALCHCSNRFGFSSVSCRWLRGKMLQFAYWMNVFSVIKHIRTRFEAIICKITTINQWLLIRINKWDKRMHALRLSVFTNQFVIQLIKSLCGWCVCALIVFQFHWKLNKAHTHYHGMVDRFVFPLQTQ